jgi:hypothetical protein
MKCNFLQFFLNTAGKFAFFATNRMVGFSKIIYLKWLFFNVKVF